jgi:uncharacterized membrane protein YdjX (TVP38/TMEM64 family)
MRRIVEFFENMDVKAWRAIAVTLGLFATVTLIFFFAKTQLGVRTEEEFTGWLEGFSDSPWGLFAAIAVFTAAAFVGAPQFVLIAACVVAFGPWRGFLYSWVATVASAAVTYYAGRLVGARALARFGGDPVNRLAGYVGRNAFYASFVIRNVPSAPFIVVNMVFGVTRAPVLGFLAGCALGVLPKTALVALFGQSFMTMTSRGDWRAGLLFAVIGLLWLALMLGARALLRRRSARA